MSESITLKNIHDDLAFLKRKMSWIERELVAIRDIDPEVRPEYLRKLAKIEAQKGKVFGKKDDFLNFLENEL